MSTKYYVIILSVLSRAKNDNNNNAPPPNKNKKQNKNTAFQRGLVAKALSQYMCGGLIISLSCNNIQAILL